MAEQKSLFGAKSTKINHTATNVVYVSDFEFSTKMYIFVIVIEVKIQRITISIIRIRTIQFDGRIMD